MRLPRRRPAGIPTGGQFAPTTNARPVLIKLPGPERNDHIAHRLGHFEIDPFADQAAAQAAVQALADELLATMPEEWLPEIDNQAGDDDIANLTECADPDVARSGCIAISEAVAEFLRHRDSAGLRRHPHHAEVVEGFGAPTAQLNCHYALLVQPHPRGAVSVLDLTHAQIDPDAPFPLVTSPADWLERLERARRAHDSDSGPAYRSDMSTQTKHEGETP